MKRFVRVSCFCQKLRVKRFVRVWWFGWTSSGWNDLSVVVCSVNDWYSVLGMVDTWILVSGYHWYSVLGIVDTWILVSDGIRVSLILGSGYRWYVDTWILVSGYDWYSVWGIIDTRFWVSLILGSGYHWYLDSGIWVSLILGLGICGFACNTWKLLLDDSPTKHLKRHSFFSPAKLTCILHPSTSAHPLQRAWRRNANASKPQFHWLYSSGRSLLAPHEEDSKSFWCLRRSLGDTPWVLPQPPWGDSPSLPGHPISFQLVPPSGCTTAQPARWPHPHLSDLLRRRFPVSRPSRGSFPLCGFSSASTPPLSCRRQEPCSASGSHFPASPPPWPQTWSLRKVVVAPPPALTC